MPKSDKVIDIRDRRKAKHIRNEMERLIFDGQPDTRFVGYTDTEVVEEVFDHLGFEKEE